MQGKYKDIFGPFSWADEIARSPVAVTGPFERKAEVNGWHRDVHCPKHCGLTFLWWVRHVDQLWLEITS